jgi:hypothetical protein
MWSGVARPEKVWFSAPERTFARAISAATKATPGSGYAISASSAMFSGATGTKSRSST